jgi:lipoic acid synthetase
MQKPQYAVKKIDFKEMHSTEKAIAGLNLHTVCHQARCPNISECYSRGTAAFLILGDTCTRNCSFCNVKKGRPVEPDNGEALKLAEAVRRLKLNYVVITSVTRDDLPDGGASAFVCAIDEIRRINSGVKIEVLVPDFEGDEKAIDTVVAAHPEVFAHNVETVPPLYRVRKGADYKRSLGVLKYAATSGRLSAVKSGLMLGLGEKEVEILEVFNDLKASGCDYLSIGQYLSPDKDHEPVVEYVTPEKFKWYEEKAYEAGFKHVESGVWVRSSYMAEKYVSR